MESLKVLYKIGHGPSSSHTLGPRKAAEIFLEKNSDAEAFRVTLYGSLAATGKGHLTDTAIRKSPSCLISEAIEICMTLCTRKNIMANIISVRIIALP